MDDTPNPDDQHCASGDRCRGYDPVTKQPAPVRGCPLCEACLTVAERDIGTLLYDYLDLAQMQDPTLSQALNSQPTGRPEPPMPLKGGPDALQREIHHALTTWETVVRATTGLSDPPALARHGAAVQRATTILLPRVRTLAQLPPTAVYPTGCEDQPTDMHGWEAIHHLQALRARARGMLGRTVRTHWIPGDCPTCDARDVNHPSGGPLYRSDPRVAGDDPIICCTACAGWRTWDDYQTYLTTLEWPA